MKKLILCLIILILLLSGCASPIVKNGGVVERGTPQPTADIEEAYADFDIVYITESGTKYHNEECSHLSNSRIPVSLEQALQHGYEPCSVCDPPT